MTPSSNFAGRGDADDIEVDIADAESFAVGVVGRLHDARHAAATA